MSTAPYSSRFFYNVYLFDNFYTDDCGDHVVVINSKEIALAGTEWRKRVYFHHNTYHGGATWTLAWELHSKDPTMVKFHCFVIKKYKKYKSFFNTHT